MALQETVLSSSSTLTCLHDLKTGSLLTSFKGGQGADFSNDSQQGSANSAYGRSAADSKGKARAVEDDESFLFRKTTDTVETKDGMGGIVASVIAGKAAINVWSFQKEAPLHRLLTPVKISCLALSPCGTYLLCGGHDGRILLWEISSGALVASFDAHYRAITCLAWTDDEAAFISGGDDAACHVWSLPIVLASAASTLTPVSAYTSLTDHTLPITNIDISFGSFPRVRVLTSALDGSCKIWDLTLRGSTLLSTFDFSALGTTRITNATWDTLERSFYAVLALPRKAPTQSQAQGAGHVSRGRVVKVDLYRQVRAGETIPVDDISPEQEDSSHGLAVSDSPDKLKNRRWTALGGGGRGDITHVSETEANSLGRFFETTDDYISSIHLSHLSSHLVVGTQQGKVHILSLPSLQSIRTIVPSQTSAMASMSSPITYLRAMIRPIDLVSRTGGSSAGAGGSGNKANEAEILPRPVAAQLSRAILQPGSKEAEERVVHVRLTGSSGNRKTLDSRLPIDETVLPPREARANRLRRLAHLGSGIGGLSAPTTSSTDSQSLQEENARLREQLARSIALNDKMWESVVDSTLAKAKDGKGDGHQPNGVHSSDVDML